MSRTSRFWLWRMPAAIGGLAVLLFAAGFVLALRGSGGGPLGGAPPPPSARAPVRRAGERLILVLGDSLARGTGDESGRGYAGDVLEIVRRRGPARLANLAVNGAESGDVVEVVSQPSVQALVSSADVILLSAGGNDLSHAVPSAGGDPAAGLRVVSETRLRFAANLRRVLQTLRRANGRAPIFVLALYDPFGDPGPRGRIGASVILSWNALVEETALAFPGVHIVPTFDLFQGRPDRLAPDRFHPNRGGYEAIAQRVAQILPADL